MFDYEKAREYEAFFAEPHVRSFELISGSGKVMLSAPHTVRQTREGKPKVAEPQTGVLAKLLHDALDCPVIYKTRNYGDDANFDAVSVYKSAVEEYVREHGVRLLLDLHQLSPRRDVQIDLGTGKFRNIGDTDLINAALRAFTGRKLGVVQIDAPFRGAGASTVSSFIARRCKIPCMQIEINSALLYREGGRSRIEDVFGALGEFIHRAEEILS